jgi:hypothetical protein
MSMFRHIYSIALRAYPSAFRRRYAEEMARLFSECFRDACGAGRSSAFHYCAHVARDLFVSAARERLATWDQGSMLTGFTAIACGCYAAYVDSHANEVVATLLVLLASSFALGCIKPRRAWRWALIVAVLLPGVHVIAFAARRDSADGHPYFSRVMVLLPALVVSFVGAYAGAFLRFIARVVSQWLEHHNDPGSTAVS